MCERWVEDGTDCNILTPSSSVSSSTSFSFCWAAQPGVTEGRKPSVCGWFSLPRTATRTPTNWLQLTQAVCGTWLYNCLTPTCFLWASQLHWIQPVHRSRWYPDIFDRMHLFLDWRLGRGPICYTIPLEIYKKKTRGLLSNSINLCSSIDSFWIMTTVHKISKYIFF